MSIKEYILQLPAWKLAVAGIVGISITVMLVDLMLIQPFFHIFNGVVTHMNKEFQADEDDLNDDSFDQGMDFHREYMDIQSDEDMGVITLPPQQFFCHKVNMVHRLERLMQSSFAKKHPGERELVQESIGYNNQVVTEGIKTHHWDPKKCPTN